MQRLPVGLSEKTLFFTLFLIAFLSLIPFLHLSPLFDEDEGYFAEISREMIESGDYITPRLNGNPEFDKPVLIYWMQAASMKLFGINEFSVRLPSAIATLIWTLVTFYFFKRHLNIQRAFLAGIFLISSIQITITGKAAIADALLNLFLTLSMFSAFDFYKERKPYQLRLAFLYSGLGFLTKGPIAILVPLAASAIFCLSQGQMKTWIKSVLNPVGISIFIVVSMPWYILEYMDQGEKFIQDFFFKHHIQRFQTALEGHSGSFLYYIPVILIGTLPHSGLVFLLFKHVKRYTAEPLYRFCLIWFLFVFIFFSLSGTKLPHYIIYGYPPLFILYADAFEQAESTWIYLVPGGLFLAVMAVVPLFIPIIINYVTDPFAVLVMKSSEGYFGLGYYLASAFLLVLILFIPHYKALSWINRNQKYLSQRRKERKEFTTKGPNKIFLATFISVIYLIFINLIIMPRVGEILQKPVKTAALIAKENNYDVVMWGRYFPSFIFYREKFVKIRKPKPGEILITKKNSLEELKGYEIIYEKNGVALARVEEP